MSEKANIDSYIVLTVITLILLLCALISAVFVRTPSVTGFSVFEVILGILIVLPLFFIAFYFIKSVFSNRMWLFFLMLTIAVAVPRVVWVLLIDTKPISDFGLYYGYALNASNGIYDIYDKTCIVFPHRLGFPLVLSVFFRILGSSLPAAKLLNVLLSLAAAFLLYRIGKEIFNIKVGQIAAFVFAFLPQQIMYTSVVASEHMFIVFFLLSLLAFILARKTDNARTRIVYYLLCGFSMSVAQLIRPVALILVPVFCIYLLLDNCGKSIIRSLVHGLKVIVIIVVSYLVLFGSFCVIVYQINGLDMFTSSTGYGLLVGTNSKYNGTYNNEDAMILREFNWDRDKVHIEAQKRAIERIRSDLAGFITLIGRKFTIFWGDETYGASWSMAHMSANKDIPISLSQLYYIIILIFALINAKFFIKEKHKLAMLIYLIFLMHVIAYSFLEIQSRYHYPAVIVLLFMSSCGIVRCIEILSGFYGYIANKGIFKRHENY